jgi:hypothetical protein
MTMVTGHIRCAIASLKEAIFEAGGPGTDCESFEIAVNASTFDAIASEAILSGPVTGRAREMTIDGVKVIRRKES